MKNFVKLGDICKIVTGSTPKSNVQEFWNGNLKWLTPAELDDNSFIVYDTERKITFDGAKATGLKPFPAGTVILSSRAPIGKVAVSGCEMYCNQGFKNLICGSRIHNIYLYWFLKSKTEFLNNLGRGATFKEISKPIVENIDIPLPSYSQQESIAEQFNKIQKLIALCMEQHALLETLVKSRFVELFGSLLTSEKAMRLEELISQGIITYHLDGNHGGLYPRADEFQSEGVPYLGANAIVDGNIDMKKAKYLAESKANILRKGIARNGDVLFAHNATVGPVAVLKTDQKKVIVSTSLTVYRCDNRRMLPEFLKYYMESTFFVNQYIKDMQQTTRNQVPITHQKKYMFIVPPIELQHQFADFVIQVDKSKFDSSNPKLIYLNWLKKKFCRNILAK